MSREQQQSVKSSLHKAVDNTLQQSQKDFLVKKIGKLHLKERLEKESEQKARVFGQGRNFFHIENWLQSYAFIRNTLRLCGLYGLGKRNARRIRCRHNDIPVKNLPEAFNGFTLLHITDLHLDVGPDFPHVLVESVSELDYDICVLTGDYRALTLGPYEPALDSLRQVLPFLKKEVYGVLGNHDSINMVPGMEEMGIKMLLNESIAIQRHDDTIYLAGIDDPHYYQTDNIEKAYQDIPQDAVSILLSHSPEIYKQAGHADFDVMLCGHTHGGQICLPGGIPLTYNANCPRQYCSGNWRYHQLHGYTSAGSGVSIVDVRLNCPAEVTLHRFVPKG